MKKIASVLFLSFVFSASVLFVCSYFFGIPYPYYRAGDVLDQLDGVHIHYNPSFGYIKDRNVSSSGYNIGLRWQCVEFVKRYYLQVYHHEFPDTYGNAVDLFDPQLGQGELNLKRGLIQYSNPSSVKPSKGDIVVFSGGYGHVAIVSNVLESKIEIAQQNTGLKTRELIDLYRENDLFHLKSPKVLGFLQAP